MKTRALVRASVVALAASALTAACSPAGDAPSAAGSSGTRVVIEADYPVYDSVDEAVDATAAVVAGTVTGQHTVLLYPDGSTDPDPAVNPQAGVPDSEAASVPPVVTTVFDVRVDSVLSGDATVGDTIQVSRLGGTADGVTYVEEDSPAFENSQSYVMFLAFHGASVPYDLINPDQGVYTLHGNDLTPLSSHGFKGLTRAAVASAGHAKPRR